ncbi:hypothetical protein C8K36_10912 [Rhodococcus sp. OK519]|uniref:hypothetical protein n=1 Tax=Rhodococcus sp. OK519 TaxID=2135729 RepID=UPI000D4B7A11|nr:hypothetical protein C8K36_10912 [Rhodococcus sp. OK519]
MTAHEKDPAPAQEEDVQSDPSGRDTWSDEGGATADGPATDADADSGDKHD